MKDQNSFLFFMVGVLAVTVGFLGYVYLSGEIEAADEPQKYIIDLNENDAHGQKDKGIRYE